MVAKLESSACRVKHYEKAKPLQILTISGFDKISNSRILTSDV